MITLTDSAADKVKQLITAEGDDGLEGARALRSRGGVVLAQDETDLLLFPPLRAAWSKRGDVARVWLSGGNARRVIFGAMNLRTGSRLFLARAKDRNADFQAMVGSIARAALTVQRDLGDRVERKHARFKYTIDDHGLDAIVAQMEQRAGFRLEPARVFHFDHNGDRFGWVEGEDGRWHYTLFIENGRIADLPVQPAAR